MVDANLDDVAVAAGGNQFLLLLKTTEATPRVLPMVIDALQAQSLLAARKGEKPARPMTHDLFVSALEMLNARVSEVAIKSVEDGTFYADVLLDRAGMEFQIDARPSDAVALAVRTGARIQIAEEVLEDSAMEEDTGGETVEA
jgi:bifunctional DNase/RNase